MKASENRARIEKLQKQEDTSEPVVPIPDWFRDKLDKHYRLKRKELGEGDDGVLNYQDKEDVLHNAYLKACEHWQSCENFDPWMNRIMWTQKQQMVMDKLKDRGHNVSIYDPEAFNQLCVEPFTDTTDLAKEVLEDIISVKNPVHRQVLELVLVHGMTHKEAGDTVGLVKDAVSKVILRFKEKYK